MAQGISSGEALATNAYRYYFPLVRNLGQVERFVTTGLDAMPPARFNAFSHARGLAGPADDTPRSMAQLDLSVGPLLLDVPAAGDRYFVLQFVDAWTNDIAYLGTRSSGADAVSAVILPPGRTGPLPAGAPADAIVIPASTGIVSIVGRYACDGPADLPAVHALQEQLVLSQLRESFAPAAGIALPEEVDAELTFWEQARCWSLAYPPAEHDVEYALAFADLGLVDADSPFPQLDAPTRRFLIAGAEAGRFAVETAVQDAWAPGIHAHDYNVDFFGPGTIDAPEWRIDDPEARFTARAVAAHADLRGAHGYETEYAREHRAPHRPAGPPAAAAPASAPASAPPPVSTQPFSG
ncbi:DUF1254 domain-containing protein [Agromyces archimandritae]|uniref:DUF1254 domain-containing protein n=1 Tax=Agromyces archimandritae TaxID=2781962 RepID=A0A975FJX4_9MICO|nr:DUF1254 domain-containing protein [Agromyces archimandritae]QTX03414.1 DUF1254 domain-containing protein [Agromyces archimandritae]